MHLFGVSDFEHYNKTVNYWSDVYGFKMPTLKKCVLKDAQVVTIPEECVASDMFKFKEIDCNKCTVEEVSQFEVDFSLKISKDTQLTGIGSSFDCFFNDEHLEYKVNLSFYLFIFLIKFYFNLTKELFFNITISYCYTLAANLISI